MDPGCVGGQVQGASSGSGDQMPGDGEQAQPQSFGFPASGLVISQRQQLHPGGDLTGQSHDRAVDLVLGEVVQREVGQAAVFGGADAVLGAGSAPVS